jgi:Lon protease-like protein
MSLDVQLSAVPLFPLPNVVLLPRAVLPIHIFEERYKAMTADVLDGDRLLAMALLLPGWERNYYARPEIDPVVCVGEILSHEKLPDGKYNFLLQGLMRARVVREHGDKPYRIAQLEPLPETPVMEIDLANERQRLTWMFGDGPLADAPLVRQFRQMLASPLPTSEVVDLIAFNLIEDVRVKQSLLAQPDARLRAQRVIRVLEQLRPVLEAIGRRKSKSPGAN